MGAEQRAALNAQLGTANPATDSLLDAFAESIANMREHDHSTQREDWYCLNLAAYMGEKAAPVLRRLLDAEAEVERLRAELATRRDQYAEAVAVVAELAQRYGRRQREHNADREELEGLRSELAARPIRANVLREAGNTEQDLHD